MELDIGKLFKMNIVKNDHNSNENSNSSYYLNYISKFQKEALNYLYQLDVLYDYDLDKHDV